VPEISLPKALLDSLQPVPGLDIAALEAAHREAPPVSVRLHPVKGGDRFKDLPQVPWCPDARYLPQRPLFTADPAFHAGAYYVQEASSMLLHHFWNELLGEKTGLRVLDLCGAPGGKSTLIASLLDSKSLLVSNEVIRSRAGILEDNMVRWGYTNSWVTSNDPRDFGRMPGYFDAVVVDAPCSGSGLFRKDHAALDEWSPQAVQLCAARQQRILADVWPCLKEGGLLIYATCSYSPQEDEAILDWLHETYEAEGCEVAMDTAWNILRTDAPQSGFPGYRCTPDRVAGEGFFIAAVRKLETASSFYYPRYRSASLKKADYASKYLLKPGNYSLQEDPRRNAFAIYPWHEPDYQFLKDLMYLRKCGVTLGMPAQKDWIPEHDLALSLDLHPGMPRWNMAEDDALRYLRKDELQPPAGIGKGWVLAAYQGLGLGWTKVLSNRVNNYLPKSWRIRMNLDGLIEGIGDREESAEDL
jgi:16S rRNA C967 or C1407 C5-methylase (RsmB/RsmF family)/NOL1/NOP2/fmu family ribosome biogenesis protein